MLVDLTEFVAVFLYCHVCPLPNNATFLSPFLLVVIRLDFLLTVSMTSLFLVKLMRGPACSNYVRQPFKKELGSSKNKEQRKVALIQRPV